MQIEQKWGFGMAPMKTDVEARRERNCAAVGNCLEDPSLARIMSLLAADGKDALGDVKGLFTRCWLQDQWDWFTVWRRLGQPGRVRCRDISYAFKQLRADAVAGDDEAVKRSAGQLRHLGASFSINVFLRRASVSVAKGQVYILSTREQRDFLKIGYTERSVEERVREINSATGVAIPFGVRALWMVSDAPEMERRIHALLAQYRIRSDREFFLMKYEEAFRRINAFIREQRIAEE